MLKLSIHRTCLSLAFIAALCMTNEGLPSNMVDAQASTPVIDLSEAIVVASSSITAREEKAIVMLIEEVEKRTRIRLTRAAVIPSNSLRPIIAVGQTQTLRSISPTIAAQLPANGPAAAEGYRIRVDSLRAPALILVVGNDERGVLYGVGRFLRSVRFGRGSLSVSPDLKIETSPATPLRGHQLGYRPKTNSYDGWTVAMWEQYIRDLVVFGVNAVELLPPRTDDDADSPHFPLPQLRMMREMSRICDEYGVDVWIWYPALDEDYANPQTVDFALREWGDVFKALPRIDAVFVPGGDPGRTQPKLLMALLEKETAVLRRYHPKAEMWMSPQGFNREWMEEFYGILRSEQPRWLKGVVHGPQVRVSLPELRSQVPASYVIRRYPDITHTRQSQYPVPRWDVAFAMTEGREPINPRPLGEAAIFRRYRADTVGFITYSEGCNDDVNKIVWSSLGWDPSSDVVEILREYSAYFISERHRESFAQGLLSLERNWQGPLATNSSVYTTLAQFQQMERNASPAELLNWRFQQALYRAYYDAYTRSRLIYELDLEDRALGILRAASPGTALSAIDEAEKILDSGVTNRVSVDWRARAFELAEALFQSIRMQLSVDRYKAIAVGRGANLDTIDAPLNNRTWLKQRFAELRVLTEESARLKGIDQICNWANPGPGGFYDDLGDISRQPHLVDGLPFEEDPSFLRSPLVGFAYAPDWHRAWWNHAEALNDGALRMRYSGLDKTAEYRIRVVYAGDSRNTRMRLVANGSIEIHPLMRKEFPVKPVEFDIPKEATKGGELLLQWTRDPGLGGNGRGCQVAEVWLIMK